MIRHAEGNLLDADVDALVNTVNTFGVMGKGIALQFKRAYPANFKAYRAACQRREVRLGRMFVFDAGQLVRPRWIVNFPTKDHWRSRSRLTKIETGLIDLRRLIGELGIRSIALPPIGCGNGGLDWRDVLPVIERVLDDVDADVIVYPPVGAPAAAMPDRTERPPLTAASPRAVIKSVVSQLTSHRRWPASPAGSRAQARLVRDPADADEQGAAISVEEAGNRLDDRILHGFVGLRLVQVSASGGLELDGEVLVVRDQLIDRAQRRQAPAAKMLSNP